jgi:hypothetical protein
MTSLDDEPGDAATMSRTAVPPARGHRRPPHDAVQGTMLPEQYYGATSRLGDVPERRLMAAVLTDALCELQSPSSAAGVEAASWIRGGGNARLSFESVCDALGFDVAWLRRSLLTAAAESRARIPVVRPTED